VVICIFVNVLQALLLIILSFSCLVFETRGELGVTRESRIPLGQQKQFWQFQTPG